MFHREKILMTNGYWVPDDDAKMGWWEEGFKWVTTLCLVLETNAFRWKEKNVQKKNIEKCDRRISALLWMFSV